MGQKYDGIRLVNSIIYLLIIFTAVKAQAFLHDLETKTPASWSDIEHVVIIVFENGSPNRVIKQPNFYALSQRGAYLTDFHAITHPSQPNYIAMVAGSTLNVSNNNVVTLQQDNIADLLEKAGKTWKVYAENYPGNCFLGKEHGLYVRKHVPFLSFKKIQDDPSRCGRIVEAQEFMVDIGRDQLPTYSLYIPNLKNDGHDTGMEYADRWLGATISPLMDNAELMKKTLFIITFDEDNYFHNNRIYTVLLGAAVRPGIATDEEYNHYNMLRTIEEIFGLGNLGRHDAKARPILEVWQ